MKIYNSLSRKKDPFTPIKKNRIGMYVCGPTVYDEPHLGHARAAYIFEVIRNYLEYKGYKVKFVKNVTDVDDKIISKAKEEFPDQEINKACSQVARKYTRRYYEDMDALGIRRASIRPFATKHIGHMSKYIAELIKKGFAYESEGSVYFDVRQFEEYGKLSGQDLDAMQSAARTEKDEQKKNPLDFALWKKAKEDEPFWSSPWGAGRPGWHIECSVMSSKYLGNEFDIHGGGIDLIFPHHENENAQSRAFSGKKFAHFWIHNGLLTINGQKMAKSLGNFISVKQFLKEYKHPNILKFFFLSSHYRNPIDYTKKRIEEAGSASERLFIMLRKVQDIFSHIDCAKKKEIEKKSEGGQFNYILGQFENAMDDDFNTPLALAVLHDLIVKSNIVITQYRQITNKDISLQQLYYSCYILLPKIASVFGLDLNIPPEMGKYLSEEIEELIKKRNAARNSGDFKLGDKIREQLLKEEVILEDTKEGTIWRRKI